MGGKPEIEGEGDNNHSGSLRPLPPTPKFSKRLNASPAIVEISLNDLSPQKSPRKEEQSNPFGPSDPSKPNIFKGDNPFKGNPLAFNNSSEIKNTLKKRPLPDVSKNYSPQMAEIYSKYFDQLSQDNSFLKEQIFNLNGKVDDLITSLKEKQSNIPNVLVMNSDDENGIQEHCGPGWLRVCKAPLSCLGSCFKGIGRFVTGCNTCLSVTERAVIYTGVGMTVVFVISVVATLAPYVDDAKDVWDWAKNLVEIVANETGTTVEEVGGNFTSITTNIVSNITAEVRKQEYTFDEIAQYIASNVSGFFNETGNFIENIGDFFGNFETAFDGLKALVEKITPALENIKESVDDVSDTVDDILDDVSPFKRDVLLLNATAS